MHDERLNANRRSREGDARVGGDGVDAGLELSHDLVAVGGPGLHLDNGPPTRRLGRPQEQDDQVRPFGALREREATVAVDADSGDGRQDQGAAVLGATTAKVGAAARPMECGQLVQVGHDDDLPDAGQRGGERLRQPIRFLADGFCDAKELSLGDAPVGFDGHWLDTNSVWARLEEVDAHLVGM